MVIIINTKNIRVCLCVHVSVLNDMTEVQNEDEHLQ